ncbi:protein fem-1 homolog A-like [Daphnia carinata]|uniref:protein fem-1 homolog A-like n=1 Tax=Daphnia carinata TaxID=120202 RepID=UPI00257ACA49|nr:protein fem-1 homolog A-like [Daphnia carinata]
MVSPGDYFVFDAVRQGLIGRIREILDTDSNKVLEKLSQRNEQGETPLQMAIRERKFEVIEFLVQAIKDNIKIDEHPRSKLMKHMSLFSWDRVDLDKFSIGPAEFGKEYTQTFVLPSPEVAIIRDIAEQTSIYKLMEYLIDVVDDELSWFEFVLNSIAASNMSRPEKIIAFELMGAAFILKIPLTEQFEPDEIAVGLRGLKCWKRALELRNSTANRRMPIPKIPYVLTDTARRAIGDAVEITTLKELKELEQQLKCHNGISDTVIQALLVIQRTFGQRKPYEAEPNLFHLKTLQEFGEHFLLTGNVIQNTQMHHRHAINISLLLMEQFSRPDSPRCFQVFIETFLFFSDILIVLERSPFDSAERSEELTFANLLAAIEFGSMIATHLILLPPVSIQHGQWRHSVMKKMHLLIIILLTTFNLDRDEDDRLNLVLANFFRIEKLRSGFSSILHLAIDKFLSTNADHLMQIIIIQKYLATGADPKVVDENGKSPLHILAEQCTPHSKESFFNVFQTLLDAGCHLDQAAPDGETVLSILRVKKKQLKSNENFDARVDMWTKSVLPLKCSCAQVIRKESIKIDGQEHELPLSVHQFIEQHCACKSKKHRE